MPKLLAVVIACALFVGCGERSISDEEAKSGSQETHSMMDWINLFEEQKRSFGGKLPNPEELKSSGHSVYIVQVGRTEDTGARLFSVKPDYASRFEIYAEMADFITALNRLEDNAAICYTTPDVAGAPAFTFAEIEKIRDQFESEERLLLVYPGG